MKSSSPGPELFRTLWHPAISVSVALSTVVTALWMVNQLAGLPGPRGLTVAAVIIATLVEAAVGNLLYSERAGIGNRVRELIIYLILIYAVSSILRPGALAARFTPSPVQAIPLIAAGFAWLYAFGLHNRLRRREALLRVFHGKSGELLRHTLIDRQHDMALTVRELKSMRRAIAGGFLVLAVMAIITATGLFTASRLAAASAPFILLCLNGVVSAPAIGALNSFADEYSVNGLGLTVPMRFQRRRISAALVVVAVAAAGAFVLSRSHSLLPFESIAAFFRWFGGLFDREPGVPFAAPVSERIQAPSQYDMLMEMIGAGEPRVPPLWPRLLAQLLRRLAVATATGAAAIMIFGPLFSPAFRAGLKNIRPREQVKNFWDRFLRQATVLARWFRARLRRAFRRRSDMPDAGTNLRRTERDAAASSCDWAPSILKRRQMNRVVAVFVSVAKWGAGHSLVYRPSEGAHEYLGRVAELYPEHRGASQICGETFWEARYSRHMVPVKRMREYVAAARRITAAG